MMAGARADPKFHIWQKKGTRPIGHPKRLVKKDHTSSINKRLQSRLRRRRCHYSSAPAPVAR